MVSVYVTILNSLGDQRTGKGLQFYFLKTKPISEVLYNIALKISWPFSCDLWILLPIENKFYTFFAIWNLLDSSLKERMWEKYSKAVVSGKISCIPLTLWPKSAQDNAQFVFLKQRSLIFECNFSLLAEFIEF